MRVDAHHHLWDPRAHDQPWLRRPELAALYRPFTVADLGLATLATGIEATVAVQAVADTVETRQLLAAAAGGALVAGVVGWIDLTDPGEAGKEITRLREGPGGDKLAGFRHGVRAEPDPGWLCRADVRESLREVAAAGLAFDLLVGPAQLPAAVETARALPELTFVLDHLGGPPVAASEGRARWAEDLRALANEPNTCAKLSGLVTAAPRPHGGGSLAAALRPYAETALEAFGPDRLMFGSDWPVCLLAATYAQVTELAQLLTTGLSARERADVFGGTATRAYRLVSV